MFTQLVKGVVVFFLFQVGEFVHNDHVEQRFRYVFEDGGNADLIFGFKFSALNPCNVMVRSEGVVNDMDPVMDYDVCANA